MANSSVTPGNTPLAKTHGPKRHRCCCNNHPIGHSHQGLGSCVKVLHKLLILGLGGGALCTYLHKEFPTTVIDGVDIDPTMLQLATKYFGFTPSDHLRAHISDGVQFVKDVASGSGN